MQQWTGTILYLGVFFAIIYFLMIRPQQKQQKQRQQMLGSVKVNDRIVTIGGIHGRVLKMKDDILTVRIADKTEIEIEKSAVGRIAGREE
ncbi:MAG TPA: preprotein translocase subunit YajC [Clostridia bacterium]|nr:preprotein translocase subunit YajC [Clostridia bacterium]